MGFFDKIKAGLTKSRNSIVNNINSVINSFTKIDEELFEELEEILITADIGVKTAQDICHSLRQKVKADGIKEPDKIKESLKQIVEDMISADSDLKLNGKPAIIMVIGVNGVGKTTTIGKIAASLVKEGKKVVLGAADTFRAAAIEQLTVWGERSGATVVSSVQGTDPASVVFDTISSAKARGADVIICDTAGRLHNKKNLMDELAKMNRVIARELPESTPEVLLVLDAATGQNAVNQAREFSFVTSVTGIVLTKLDGTAKGGVVIPINNELHIPVKFIGVGEGIDDLQPFDAKVYAESLFSEE